jgi:RNA polymerase sigma factor (sigma-70 family)
LAARGLSGNGRDFGSGYTRLEIPIRGGWRLLSDVRDITATLDRDEPSEATRPPVLALAATPEWVATLHDHGPLLLAAARAIARDEAEAEDLVQTTFERALRAGPAIREPLAIRAWLLTVQTREALRVVRRLRRTLRLDPTIHEMPVGGPDTSESIELDETLGRLSRPIRAAVVLHHMIGLSVRETADALGVTENTAKARLKTGLARLRELLHED